MHYEVLEIQILRAIKYKEISIAFSLGSSTLGFSFFGSGQEFCNCSLWFPRGKSESGGVDACFNYTNEISFNPFIKKEHEKTPDFRREMIVLIRFSDWQ
jgi:hypothetical protein